MLQHDSTTVPATGSLGERDPDRFVKGGKTSAPSGMVGRLAALAWIVSAWPAFCGPVVYDLYFTENGGNRSLIRIRLTEGQAGVPIGGTAGQFTINGVECIGCTATVKNALTAAPFVTATMLRTSAGRDDISLLSAGPGSSWAVSIPAGLITTPAGTPVPVPPAGPFIVDQPGAEDTRLKLNGSFIPYRDLRLEVTREGSCNPNDLLLDWPVRLNPAANPVFANFPKWIDLGMVVGLTGTLARTIDYQGNTGHNGTDTGAPHWRAANDGTLEVRSMAGGYLDLARDGLFDHMVGGDNWQLFGQLESYPGVQDGSGNVVFLRHLSGFVTHYAHLKKGLAVTQKYRIGDWVPAGTVLGGMASSGASSGIHLHYTVMSSKACKDQGLIAPGGRVSQFHYPPHGYWIEPQMPINGKTMFRGVEGVDYPVYNHCSQRAFDFADVSLTATAGHRRNPPRNVSAVPLNSMVRYSTYSCGIINAGDSAAVAIRNPASSETRSPLSGTIASFPATAAGEYTVDLLRTTGGQTSSRGTAKVNVLGGLVARSFRSRNDYSIQESTLGSGTGQTVSGGLVAGDDASNRQIRGFSHFDLTGIPAAANVRYAVLRAKVTRIDGRNPFGPLFGEGWGGRLVAGLGPVACPASACTPSQQPLPPQAAEFADTLAPAGQFSQTVDAGNWTEAEIPAEGLLFIKSIIGAAPASTPWLRARLWWESAENRNSALDALTFAESELVLYYDGPDAWAPAALVNVALGKPATQSSTVAGGIASRAVDGNVASQWAGGSVTHTDAGGQQYWEVDLQARYRIAYVEIYPRAADGCNDTGTWYDCSARLTNFDVCFSEQPFGSTSLAALRANPAVSCQMAGQTPIQIVKTVDVNRNGRYVRIQMDGSPPQNPAVTALVLSLAEVVVMGSGPTMDFFENSQYGGASLGRGTSEPWLGDAGKGLDWNQRISSLKVPPGLSVSLYSQANYAGASRIFTADAPDLASVPGPCGGTWNDCASSLKIQGAPATITASGGSPQSASAGAPFATTLWALVRDASNNPAGGVTVTFTAPSSGASATLSGATAVTNASGVASVTATANGVLGGYVISASVAGVAGTANFSLTNTAGPPASIAAAGGTPQSAAAGAPFAVALAAMVRDASNNPVSGVTVTFTVPASGASATLSSSTAVTNAAGVASVSARANNTSGGYGVTAAAPGVAAAANFALSNTAVPGSISATTGTPQSAVAGASFRTALSAIVKDTGGNPMSGVTVVFAAPASGASAVLPAPSAVTGSAGIASVKAAANMVPGSYTVNASVVGIAAPAAFALTNTSGNGLPAPNVTSPANASVVTGSVVLLQWTAVPNATRYELRLIETNTPQQFRVEVLAPLTSAIYTLPSGSYREEVRACGSTGCGLVGSSSFTLRPPAIPSHAVTGLSCSDNVSTGLTCSWDRAAQADFYFLNVVQPGAGPGGGALTVAGRQVGQPGTNQRPALTIPVPPGSMSVLVRACTGDGCGPFGAPVVVAVGGAPSLPSLGEPFAGSSVDGSPNAPLVRFAWNRIPNDRGNVTYRLYVQDFSRNAAALDVYTKNNFYAAYFNPGTRYDAIVFADDGVASRQGPPNAFVTRGRPPKSPVVTAPPFGSAVRIGTSPVRISWTPMVESDGTNLPRRYQYFFNGPRQISGVVDDTTLLLTLNPASDKGKWQGVVRACLTGLNCAATSPNGWGPWNNEPGSEGGMAEFIAQ